MVPAEANQAALGDAVCPVLTGLCSGEEWLACALQWCGSVLCFAVTVTTWRMKGLGYTLDQ